MNDKHSIPPLPPENGRYPGTKAIVAVQGIAEVLGASGLEELRIVGVRLAVVMTTAVLVDDLLVQIDGQTVAYDPDTHGALVRVVLLSD